MKTLILILTVSLVGSACKKKEAIVNTPVPASQANPVPGSDITDYTKGLQNSLQKAERAGALANKAIRQTEGSAENASEGE